MFERGLNLNQSFEMELLFNIQFFSTKRPQNKRTCTLKRCKLILLHKVERQTGNLRNAQLKKELVEANSTISILKSDLETAQAKNRSDIETIKIQQMKIENVVSKCAAYKVSTKKCQDEFSEKEKEMNKERYNIRLFWPETLLNIAQFFPEFC